MIIDEVRQHLEIMIARHVDCASGCELAQTYRVCLAALHEVDAGRALEDVTKMLRPRPEVAEARRRFEAAQEAFDGALRGEGA